MITERIVTCAATLTFAGAALSFHPYQIVPLPELPAQALKVLTVLPWCNQLKRLVHEIVYSVRRPKREPREGRAPMLARSLLDIYMDIRSRRSP